MEITRKIPSHVAIIMDGNGRWAKRRGKPRVFGHVRGTGRIKSIVERADHIGIKALTFFAFSTENWSRPSQELKVLWGLLIKYLKKEINELYEKDIRLNVIGETDRLPDEVKKVLYPACERLSKNAGMLLTFAVSYGGRRDIVFAAKKFAQDCLSKKIQLEHLTEKTFNDYLWTGFMGDLSEVDLLIRTSGEKRISNFMLWQSAYAEFVFTDIFWPDFSSRHFEEALTHYSERDRRYGSLTEDAMKDVRQVTKGFQLTDTKHGSYSNSTSA